jgi:hypothetical protein
MEKVSQLRKELLKIRKEKMMPVGKMGKKEVMAELMGYKGHVPMEHIVREVEAEVSVPKGKMQDKVVKKHIKEAEKEIKSKVVLKKEVMEKPVKEPVKEPVSALKEVQKIRKEKGVSLKEAWAMYKK